MAGSVTDFIAIGAGHLAGLNNVQEILGKRGFKVEPLHYPCVE